MPGSLFLPEEPWKTSSTNLFAVSKSPEATASVALSVFIFLSFSRRAHLWQCASLNFVKATLSAHSLMALKQQTVNKLSAFSEYFRSCGFKVNI